MRHTIGKWDRRFLALAKHVSAWSKDVSTKVGAVIADPNRKVIGLGYNGFAAGVNDSDERLQDRETRLRLTIHAEKNAIFNARSDVSRCTLYVHPMPPCSQCAAAIVQTGIRRVVATMPTDDQRARWGDVWDLADVMYYEAGVHLILVEPAEF